MLEIKSCSTKTLTILIIWPIKQAFPDSRYIFRDTTFHNYKSRLSSFLKYLKQSFQAKENEVLLMEYPEQAFESFQSICTKMMSQFALVKKKPSKKPHLPGFNNAFKNFEKKRNKAHRNFKK